MSLGSPNKKWFAVSAEAKPEASEAIEFALLENGALGTEIDLLGKKEVELLMVRGYFNEPPDIGSLKEKIFEALGIYELPPEALESVSLSEVPDQDWLAEWKKHWIPTETAKFIIAPSWEAIEDAERIIVKIEPNMAFGTGTHETTRLCLRAIEENYHLGESFFDVGTGTGILAIAAAKLNARLNKTGNIIACDTDQTSIGIASENALLNLCESISFYEGSITESSPEADFVCANLTADVIIPLLPLLVAKSRRILVLSGILAEQEEEVVSELSRIGAKPAETERDGEWISILLKK